MACSKYTDLLAWTHLNDVRINKDFFHETFKESYKDTCYI